MIEIERKYLVDTSLLPDLQQFKKLRLTQGYLNKSGDVTVRVRLSNQDAFLTIKGKSVNLTRSEFEYSIPFVEAEIMLDLCGDATVSKIRYLIPIGKHTWELDVFTDKLQGLVLAEIELDSENEPFEIPAWLGLEVSLDHRYFNSSLSRLNQEEAKELVLS
jgi:adenylate cyclase